MTSGHERVAKQGAGSALLPMASPPRDVAVALANDDFAVASVSLHVDRRELVETAIQHRFGITQTRFRADVEHKGVAATGPHIVRFHEAGDRIRSEIDGAVRSTWVVLSESFLEDVVSGTSAWRRPFGNPFVAPPLETLGALHRFFAQARKSADALWAQEELIALVPRLLSGPGDERPAHLRPGALRIARDADALLEREFAGAVSVSRLARRLGVSTSYLTRAYRAATGRTLHARVTRLRLSQALDRLAAGADDLTALALELGYSSHSHFTAEFKRHVGRPPSAFRLSTQV